MSPSKPSASTTASSPSAQSPLPQPVNLGKPSLRRRLEAYYTKVAPDQIAVQSDWKDRLDKIWEKFGGSVEGEAKLAAKLAKKYGPLVQLQIVTAPPQQQRRRAQEADPGGS